MGVGTGPSHIIKRYSNRKLYDTTDKRYLTIEEIGEMVTRGETVMVVDNETGIDITNVTLSQVILDREKKAETSSIPSDFLRDIIEKGKDAASSYLKTSARGLVEDALLSGEGVEEAVRRLIKQRLLSREEGKKLIDYIVKKASENRDVIERKVDERVGALLDRFDLPRRGELDRLARAIEVLEKKVDGALVADDAPRAAKPKIRAPRKPGRAPSSKAGKGPAA